MLLIVHHVGEHLSGSPARCRCSERTRTAPADAKKMALVREQAEARIPDHLLYTKGWPTRIPTRDEAELLCDVRLKVAAAVGLADVYYLEPDALIRRYEHLMQEKESA